MYTEPPLSLALQFKSEKLFYSNIFNSEEIIGALRGAKIDETPAKRRKNLSRKA
jgi:hypothetical protein